MCVPPSLILDLTQTEYSILMACDSLMTFELRSTITFVFFWKWARASSVLQDDMLEHDVTSDNILMI